MYTFETLLHQELGKGPTKEELCKSIQRILERVLKVSGPVPALDPPALSVAPGWPQAGCPCRRHYSPTCANQDTAQVGPLAFRPPAGAGGAPASEPPCSFLPSQKYDYDSSSVRKRFFREALLQITIPFLLKKLAPTCKSVSGPAPPQPRWGEPAGPLAPRP